MKTGMRFHHIGYACNDLDGEAERLSVLGYIREGEDFSDPLQKVYGRFLIGAGPRLELLAQHKDASVLEPWLSKGIKMYHLAYEVHDLREEIDRFRKNGAKVIVRPVPANAFGEREISFLLLPTMLLIELIQEDVKEL